MRGGCAVHKRGAPWREHLELASVAAAAAAAQPPYGAAGPGLWAHLPDGEGRLLLASQPGALLPPPPPREISMQRSGARLAFCRHADLYPARSCSISGSQVYRSVLPCFCPGVQCVLKDCKKRPGGQVRHIVELSANMPPRAHLCLQRAEEAETIPLGACLGSLVEADFLSCCNC